MMTYHFILHVGIIILLSVCYRSYSNEKPQYRHEKPQPIYEKLPNFYEIPQPKYKTPQPTYENPQPTYENPQTSNKNAPSNQEPFNQDAPRRHTSTSYLTQSTKDKVWRFELNLPEVLDNLKKYAGVSITDVKSKSRHHKPLRGKGDNILSHKIRLDVKAPNINKLMGYISDMVDMKPIRRVFDRIQYGYVEEGPGAIKSMQVIYPPNFQEGHLKHLLHLKEKRQQKAQG